jgi:uncharacterized membrane protein YgcG
MEVDATMGNDATCRERGLLARILRLAVLGGCLMGAVGGCAYEQTDTVDPYYDSGTVYTQPETAAPLPGQLEQLVAPIALYPDPLVAQILAAATYPAQIVEAQRWMTQNTALKGDALAKAADQQLWDPSVKAMTQFPEVLSMMDKNLAWTSSLGEAYMSNAQAVMDAVQRLRQRAQSAGNLKSTQQENVTSDGGVIQIQPATTEVIYVPEYDPWLIYGTPLEIWPGWVGYPGLYFVGPGILYPFGIGLYGGFGWGWSSWRPDWGGHGIWYRGGAWHSSSPSFWGHHPGQPGGAFGRGPGFVRPGEGAPHVGAPGGAMRGGMRSGAFSGIGHGGATGGFSQRGGASIGGGGFHGGGGGSRGGGGGRR